MLFYWPGFAGTPVSKYSTHDNLLSGAALLNFLLGHSLLEQFQILKSSAPNLQLFIEASSSAPVFIC